jgi:hypothetical protein
MVFLKIKSQIKSPFFNVILKISKSSKKRFKIRFCKIVNQIVEYPGSGSVSALGKIDPGLIPGRGKMLLIE